MPRKIAVKSHGLARKWTPPLKGAFLEALKTVRFISQACELSGVPRRTVYEWRDADPSFALAMDEAEICFADDIREEVRRRAMGDNGSDELLKMLAKAKAPEFQDKGNGTVNVNFVQLVAGRIQGLVQRFFPVECPHCGKYLEDRKQFAQELSRLDAIEVTASAVNPE